MKIIRIDDFPTGCRPILSDMSSIYDFLSLFDEYNLPYYLGIVPTLVSKDNASFLRNHAYYMNPALHGFTHKYFEKSKICLKNDDLENKFSVAGDFDEFDPRYFSQEDVDLLILSGYRLLESLTCKYVQTYIPPNNKISYMTYNALIKAEFKMIMCEDDPLFAPNSTKIQFIKSSFYGRLRDYVPSKDHTVVSLHATWEADSVREYGIRTTKDRVKMLADWFYGRN